MAHQILTEFQSNKVVAIFYRLLAKHGYLKSKF